MKMEGKMKEAGIDTEKVKLANMARRILAMNNDRQHALGAFVTSVTRDPNLLIALIGWDEIHDRAEQYLAARAKEQGGGASHDANESHVTLDRPSTTPQASAGKGRPKDDSQARTSMTKAGARAVALSPFWDQKIGREMRLRDITLFDVINLKRAGLIQAGVCARLQEKFDPDKPTQKLPEVADQAEMSAVYDEVRAGLPSEPEHLRHVAQGSP